jgi:hypothetical protein
MKTYGWLIGSFDGHLYDRIYCGNKEDALVRIKELKATNKKIIFCEKVSKVIEGSPVLYETVGKIDCYGNPILPYWTK